MYSPFWYEYATCEFTFICLLYVIYLFHSHTRRNKKINNLKSEKKNTFFSQSILIIAS